MKKFNKILITTLLALICVLCFAACGGNGDNGGNGGGGNGGGNNNTTLGTTPNIPSWTNGLADATTADDIEDILVENGWSNFESYSAGGMTSAYAEKTIGGKDYVFAVYTTADNTAASNYFSQMASAYTMLQSLSGVQLKAVLDELAADGITNLNVTSTAVSYTENGYECFVKLIGNLVVMQGPADGNTDDPTGTIGEYSLPTNLKVVYSQSGLSRTVIKIGNDYYSYRTQSGTNSIYRYLKYNAGTQTWQKYTNNSFVSLSETAPSSWTAEVGTITQSGLRSVLAGTDFFGGVLSYLDLDNNYVETGTNTLLNRPVTIYTGGGYTLCIDDATGVTLQVSLGTIICSINTWDETVTTTGVDPTSFIDNGGGTPDVPDSAELPEFHASWIVIDTDIDEYQEYYEIEHSSANATQVANYVAALKAAGFVNINVDMGVMGMIIFTATDNVGKMVSLYYADGDFTITLYID